MLILTIHLLSCMHCILGMMSSIGMMSNVQLKLFMLEVKLSTCMLDLIGSYFDHFFCDFYTTVHQ